MQLSYWEYDSWLAKTDFTIVGSGIVGLSCALHLRERFPKARILVLEKGILPQGASTKNAGFACFGSMSEILSDLIHHSREEVVNLVSQRWQGIQHLRQLLGDSRIGFRNFGGHEIFQQDQDALFERCLQNLNEVNTLLKPVFGQAPFRIQPNLFRFRGVKEQYITHALEGQIDTGKMMVALWQKAVAKGIRILNGLEVSHFEADVQGVQVMTGEFEYHTANLLIATNGFASRFVGKEVQPARAQVLITHPIPGLKIKGTFHLDEGYYYFRNVGKRILLGGGRNLDIRGETTTEAGLTTQIQERLEQLLQEVILPGKPLEIAQRWSGIMGVGSAKKPIIRQLSDRVFCGVRLGGMGIAIGSLVGRELAALPS